MLKRCPFLKRILKNYRMLLIFLLFSIIITPAIAGVIEIPTGSYASSPSIDNNRIVWIDEHSGQVMMYDLDTQTRTQITTNSHNHLNPMISGNTIIYSDDGGTKVNYNLFMYDIPTKTETAITDTHDIDYSSNVGISGRKIFWSNYMYDIPTKTRTTIPVPPSPSHSQICSQMVKTENVGVYGCSEEKNYPIPEFYLVDFRTNEKTLMNIPTTARAGIGLWPLVGISGHRFAWTDWRNGNISYDPSAYLGIKSENADIYMYDLDTKTETPVTKDPGNQSLVGISGDKLWYTDDLNSVGKAELVVHDIPTNQETRVSIKELDPTRLGGDPNVISNDKIVYVRQSNIYLYSPSISGTISSGVGGSSSESAPATNSGQPIKGKTPISLSVIILAIVVALLCYKQKIPK
jgi:beta propeller repeat protein